MERGLEPRDPDFAQQSQDVLISKSDGAVLIGGSSVWVAGIGGGPILQQPKCGGHVSLSRKIHVAVGAQIATILSVAGTWNIDGPKGPSVLAIAPPAKVHQVVHNRTGSFVY